MKYKPVLIEGDNPRVVEKAAQDVLVQTRKVGLYFGE